MGRPDSEELHESMRDQAAAKNVRTRESSDRFTYYEFPYVEYRLNKYTRLNK